MLREFSSEALLSLVEFVQFQSFLREFAQQQSIPLRECHVHGKPMWKPVAFYNAIPLSSIVHEVGLTLTEEDDTENVERSPVAVIASSLHEKYIRRHCELEINISAALRNRWAIAVLDVQNDDKDELSNLNVLVNSVILEMIKYVRQSFIRWSYKP